ncbi:hypothetical protein SLNSH_04305 [Alsobacter soli]|uniref:CDP-alcohol phosphatidyltransferase family protein n=1 Tax=Alsobacter soli TaxID=2109933 RepID=A0A2T1HXU1_9HYPH|nr:CDP-alcohol phosphatidyltransferase family protein [Alsobacter soli]PSC06506.1 hypothetical protein SLNSH_04305 [Alsobacter soli]
MLVWIQRFFQMDDATFRFAGWYLGVGLPLLALGLAMSKPRHGGAALRAATDQPSGVVRLGLAIGRGVVRGVARLPVTPNQITVIGLILTALLCALLVVSKNSFWFGSGLIAALLFDTLDGLVARAQGASTRFGGYLDAVVDRYQEAAIYLTVGWVLDQWPVAFLIITGSMLTSYNKARVALEAPTANKDWPDLLEKPIRLFILCVGLIGAPIMAWFLPFALWMLAALTHFTALQRFTRAAFLLRQRDVADRVGMVP